MSFYNTTNPSKFARQNDAAYVSQNLQFLRSGFQQPFASTGAYLNISGPDHQYTPIELLSRYIVRTGNNSGTDVLPTAVGIINTIKAQQDVRSLAQDSNVIVPRRGFYWDVCFSALSSESFYEYAVVSPNFAYEIDPSVDGVVTITNCLDDIELPPNFPIFFVQGGNYYGEGDWNPNGKLIWVRFTLVNLDPEAGYLEVNASVLTNNCYLVPPETMSSSSKMVQTFEKAKDIAQRQKEARKKRVSV
jgi:hypothetical protein